MWHGGPVKKSVQKTQQAPNHFSICLYSGQSNVIIQNQTVNFACPKDPASRTKYQRGERKGTRDLDTLIVLL